MEKFVADSILNEISSKINELGEAVNVARNSNDVDVIYIGTYQYNGKQVFLMTDSWLALRGKYRRYKVELHSEYDADLPRMKRNFKIWFEHDGVVYYCLMSGEEAVENGFALPRE